MISFFYYIIILKKYTKKLNQSTGLLILDGEKGGRVTFLIYENKGM